ncbi:MAG: hypothetical protein KDC38_14935, partial [Planctomycetes bacterium]|nr:hypothetical protein [Planctomycetota bacterium]
MTIAYCDNCGEIITGGQYEPGRETLCSGCLRNRGSAEQSEVAPATPASSGPNVFAPSATMVMSAEDLAVASQTERRLASIQPELDRRAAQSASTRHDHDDLDDYSVGGMLDNDELDLFSSDTIARRKASKGRRTSSNLSIVAEEECADDFDPADLPSGGSPSGLEVFDQTLHLTGETKTSARHPESTRVMANSSHRAAVEISAPVPQLSESRVTEPPVRIPTPPPARAEAPSTVTPRIQATEPPTWTGDASETSPRADRPGSAGLAANDGGA